MLEIISVETDNELPDETISILSGFVSPETKNKAARYRHKQNAVNTLIGEIITRKAIFERTGLSKEKIVILSDKCGKPYLANIPGLHFNISHSGDLVVCAVDEEPIGVDIELIRAAKQGIAKRFFSNDEYEFVMSDPDKNSAAFYKIWTMKESYAKWKGGGLSMSLNSFSVLEIEKQGSLFFHHIDVRADACCYVCTTSGGIGSHRHFKPGEFLAHLEK